ncbi:ferritin-like domain-containing protein [Psychroflexus aestuariivivens]|uniref:ferritin-like domain-containing protein n=1 Tax=Psychroflexus aestuariivivens TaxID=1795040 RepID=UPI000FD6FB46|nr:PA2169 family four-helix-bundle protein [Psychroflexus aestuariivivens]
MKYTKEISNKLNELLEKNYDAEAGYIAAKENVKNSNLKNFFKERATDRYDFGHELKDEIKSYGEEPDKGTSWKGEAHRAWMNLKSTFSSNSDDAILQEAIRGEKAALEDYNKIIQNADLTPSTKKVLEKQRDSVQSALDMVKTVEDFI